MNDLQSKSSVPTSGQAPEPTFNEMVLFWASFMTLIAAGIGFSVRGDILGARARNLASRNPN